MKCRRCAEPVQDAPTCTDCAALLHHALRDVPALVVELETVLARLTAYTEQAQRVTGTGETPVPYRKDAANQLRRLRNTLGTWCRLVHEEKYAGRTHPVIGPLCDGCQTGSMRHWSCMLIRKTWRPWPDDKPASMAGWLKGEVEWLRHHDAGPDAIDEIRDAVRAVRGVLDSPAGRKTDPLGSCPEPGCAGQIQAYVPRDPNVMSHCDCNADPMHTWDSTQFMRLSKRMLRESERINA